MEKKLSCRLGKRDLKVKDIHYQLLDETYRITKPTIICFGGNATLQDRYANTMCKVAERLIGLKEPTEMNEYATSADVDIVGITYAPSYNKHGKKLDTSHLVKDDVEILAKQLLCPLVIQDGQRLPLEHACKNITNVTFLSHSLGTREVAKVIQRLAVEMMASGYNKQETNTIIRNITSVSFGPFITISEQNKRVTGSAFPEVQQFNIKSLKDDFDMEYEYATGKKADSLNGIEFIKSRVTDNEYNLYADHFTPSSVDDHMIGCVILRDDNWENISWDTDEKGNHWYVGKNADAASQYAGYILATAVANALQNNNSTTFIPKPTAEDLVIDCMEIASGIEDLNVQ